MNAQYFYESNDANILLIQEKGNWNSSFSFFRNLEFEKGNTSFQSGFSPLEHLVLSANFFHVKSKRWSIETEEDYRNGFSTGIAVGYYYLFDQNRKQGGLLFDSYLGYNLGNYRIDFSKAGNSKISYHKYYMQIGIHKIMDQLSLSLVVRVGHFNLKKIELFGKMPAVDFDYFKFMSEQRIYTVQEFSFKISYKVANVYLFTTLNFFPRLESSTFENPFNNYNIGVLFPFES